MAHRPSRALAWAGRLALAAWLAGALPLASGCTAAPSGAIDPAAVTIAFEPCRVPGVEGAARCGVLAVPRDRAEPSAGELELRVVWVPARGPAMGPPVALLAGGPGQAASEAFAPLLPILDEALSRRDVLLVDQRGTGSSAPLDCPRPQGLAASFAKDAMARMVDGCLAALDDGEGAPRNPAHYTSDASAADLDAVRAAMGVAQLDLIGGSYGTRLALVYARNYPAHVRSMVLDGVAPPDMALPSSFPRDAQLALDAMFAACDGDPGCAAAFPTLRADLTAWLAAADGSAVRVRDPHNGSPVELPLTREAILGGLQSLLYVPDLLSVAPLAITRARAGDLGPFAALVDAMGAAGESLSMGLFLAIVCAEDLPRVAALGADARAELLAGSVFGDTQIAELEAACAHYPHAELDASYGDPVTVDVPTLVLSGAVDPVTPPSWGELQASRLPAARHVIVPHTGHGTLSRGCVPELVATFLDDPRAAVASLDASCVDALARPAFFIDHAGPPH